MHLKNCYVKENLTISELNKDDIKEFEVFISNFLNSKNGIDKHYLSKNNNQILRIKSLLELMPKAKFIIMFRNPLQHAGSLLSQHVNYCKEQKEDSFMLNYMNWIGHYEFGLNQKSFKFDNTNSDNEIREIDKNSINFWLYTWKNYYQYVLSLESLNIFLISFEDFCIKEKYSIKGLSKFLQFNENELDDLNIYEPSERTFEGIDQELLKECDIIYSDLIEKTKTQ
jgi:hypothetical protein